MRKRYILHNFYFCREFAGRKNIITSYILPDNASVTLVYVRFRACSQQYPFFEIALKGISVIHVLFLPNEYWWASNV